MYLAWSSEVVKKAKQKTARDPGFKCWVYASLVNCLVFPFLLYCVFSMFSVRISPQLQTHAPMPTALPCVCSVLTLRNTHVSVLMMTTMKLTVWVGLQISSGHDTFSRNTHVQWASRQVYASPTHPAQLCARMSINDISDHDKHVCTS